MDNGDQLAPARGCLRGMLLGILCWALIGLIALQIVRPDSQPSSDVAGGLNVATSRDMDVMGLFREEAAHVRAMGFPLQRVAVDISDPMAWLGRTVLCETGCDRLILLRSWYWQEAQARYVIDYEIARVLAHDAGLDPDTPFNNKDPSQRSDLFVACFGSPPAQEYLARLTKVAGDCDELRRLLAGS